MKIKTFHIITIGCQMNKADSQRLSSYLKQHGLKMEEDSDKADLIAVNTCGIRQSAEDRAYGLINTIRKNNPKAKIVVMGCISHRKEVRSRLKGKADLFISNSEMPNILPMMGDISSNILSKKELREMGGEKYLAIAPDHDSDFSAFVPIGNGCNNFCSYCVVPYARGREVYRPAEDIINEIKDLVKNGYKEIILIAQNVNSYNSGDYSFANLLEDVANIAGDFWIRFSSSHPKDLSDELIEVIGKYRKICPHLHLAVQSGDDEILELMNRRYSAGHYLKLIDKVRESRPGIAITTDVIVGFPGETEKQFENTVRLFEKAGFDMAYISRFSPRPHTAAWNMADDVSREEKRRREEVLTDMLLQSFKDINEKEVGNKVRVLLEGKNDKGIYYGKTDSYKTVRISNSNDIELSLGSFVDVVITGVNRFSLRGEVE